MTISEQLRQVGRVEARVSVLQRLLEVKFGALSNEARQRVQSASEQQVERWTERVLTADSVQAVFGE